ncbi:MAG: Re/Si-specific NAD(P)(+) transhydrogenase subunit alpha [Saprospiraceae bacterium]|nr:Re/Si-specific NAD(P)(+) transhydrogenase subunit alpha [Saprospiraceae bacterium]
MILGVLKERREGEKRVAITPQVTKQFIDKGFQLIIETGAGELSSYRDQDYIKAGATIAANKGSLLQSCDVAFKINPPLSEEIQVAKKGLVWLSLLYHLSQPALIQEIANAEQTAISMDAIPRISRAQSMDVLSSQSNLAGYKAVLLGSDYMTRAFPLMMTAAGTITPAKILIFGVGVAGLQAIATAKRLGAVVEATDVRMETKEQAEFLGAKFIIVKDDGVKTEGGYAKEVTEEYLAKQKEAVNKSLFLADLVITTALVPGKKAPVLIRAEQVQQMKYGSVIVDMAAEQGGNCELTQEGKVVVENGVKIVGLTNLPSSLATNASELYAKNVINLFVHLASKDGFKNDLEEEITKATLIVQNGKILRS